MARVGGGCCGCIASTQQPAAAHLSSQPPLSSRSRSLPFSSYSFSMSVVCSLSLLIPNLFNSISMTDRLASGRAWRDGQVIRNWSASCCLAAQNFLAKLLFVVVVIVIVVYQTNERNSSSLAGPFQSGNEGTTESKELAPTRHVPFSPVDVVQSIHKRLGVASK